MDHDHAQQEQLRTLANALDCFTEAEHLLLSGWTPKTAEGKRKRGDGPPYILHGKNYFYPRKQYAEYLQNRVKETRGLRVESVL